jgi:hypothetical protein
VQLPHRQMWQAAVLVTVYDKGGRQSEGGV